MKLGDIVKVEVSYISIIITEHRPKKYQIVNLQVCNKLGVTLCMSCLTILEITKTGGT